MVNIARNASVTDAFITASKREIQKRAETTFDFIGNNKIKKLKLQKFQKIHNKIIWKQLQMGMTKKYLKKDIYLQKKTKKLLMN